VALALSLAMKAADRARTLQQQLDESEVISPSGSRTSITQGSTPALYDFLEECMTVVTFSFQALEAYCNETISRTLTGTYPLIRGKGRRRIDMTADELERAASTEEKLATILPDLLEITSPKGNRPWEDFVRLKEARDATIHIKSRDSAPRVMQPSDLDYQTLFHGFLRADISAWVRAAVAMLLWFATVDEIPRWLEHVRKTLGMQAKGPALNQAKKNSLPRGQRGNSGRH
jgi:hypothetical protein